MKHRVIATLLALGAVACEQDREGAQGFHAEVRDSADIRIVENERPPDGSRLGWRIGPEPSASIGELEGENPYMLHHVSGLTKLRDGRIVVANAGSQELRVFDASGTHLATWGGRGEGPGEFTDLSEVARWPGDSIVAWYSHGRAISVFDGDGNFGRALSLAKAGKLSPPRLQSARADGTILSYRMASVADTAVPEIWEGDGTLSASLGAHPGMMQITVTKSGKLVVPVFGRVLLLGLWGDLVVASPTTRYEIRAFQGDGTLARIVRRDHLLRAPTEADREKSMEKLLSSRGEVPEPQQIAEALREQRECCPLAKTFPAFSRVIGDAAGHLWVREHDFPGEDGPTPLWTVFDPEGHVLGFIETPKDLWIFEIGEDYLLGRTTDELGVEKVQLWPLER